MKKVCVKKYRQLDSKCISEYFPEREKNTYKGNYGKVLLFCGSVGCTGAAILSAQAAVRTGSGLVYLCVPDSIYVPVCAALREPVIIPYRGVSGIPAADKLLSKMDAVLCGPGIGISEESERLVEWLLKYCSVPLLLDADAITIIGKHPQWLQERNCPAVLTPHDGEYARLNAVRDTDRYCDILNYAQKNHCILLRKGYQTLISDGKTVYRNITGNPGMAKGGSGDVLSGVIVSLLGRRIPPLKAAACGAWVHGRAGDICAEKYGEYAMLPSDMIEMLKVILP